MILVLHKKWLELKKKKQGLLLFGIEIYRQNTLTCILNFINV